MHFGQFRNPLKNVPSILAKNVRLHHKTLMQSIGYTLKFTNTENVGTYQPNMLMLFGAVKALAMCLK